MILHHVCSQQFVVLCNLLFFSLSFCVNIPLVHTNKTDSISVRDSFSVHELFARFAEEALLLPIDLRPEEAGAPHRSVEARAHLPSIYPRSLVLQHSPRREGQHRGKGAATEAPSTAHKTWLCEPRAYLSFCAPKIGKRTKME